MADKQGMVKVCHNCQKLNPNPGGEGHCVQCGAVVNPVMAST